MLPVTPEKPGLLIWVKILGLPMECHLPECLIKIANMIGRPSCMDQVTTIEGQIGVAKCCVEIKVDSKCPTVLNLALDDGLCFTAQMEYYNLLPICHTCNCFGHDCSKISRFKRVWMPKEKTVNKELVVGQVASEPIIQDIASLERLQDEAAVVMIVEVVLAEPITELVNVEEHGEEVVNVELHETKLIYVAKPEAKELDIPCVGNCKEVEVLERR
ncbi:unnamed protein product [Linum trigynum]|uniref:DUF4283 domain-containing protein n=1 Tax=Linum trigynum TaxID=586398 RepID=A0AAV2DVY1_9ROSI